MYHSREERCDLPASAVLKLLPRRSDTRKKRPSRASRPGNAKGSDLDGSDDELDEKHAGEHKLEEPVTDSEPVRDVVEGKLHRAVGQVLRVLAKQSVQKLRQIYKRQFKYPMFVSGVDPLIGSVNPATDYICLLPPDDLPPELGMPLPEEEADDFDPAGSDTEDKAGDHDAESDGADHSRFIDNDGKEEKVDPAPSLLALPGSSMADSDRSRPAAKPLPLPNRVSRASHQALALTQRLRRFQVQAHLGLPRFPRHRESVRFHRPTASTWKPPSLPKASMSRNI